VAINPGPEQNQSVMVGDLAVYPDLLLYSTEKTNRLEATVEVETSESVNQLEALAEWGVFSKLKAAFYLYVPPQCLESVRRICDEHQFPVAEIWTYHMALDQIRFTQVYRSPNAPKPVAGKSDEKAAATRPAPASARTSKPKPAARGAAPRAARSSKAGKVARPATPARSGRAAAVAKAKAKAKAKAAKPSLKAKAARKRR
jgi:hypothetical protein